MSHESAKTTSGTTTPTAEMHWTRHRIIAALQAWARDHGGPPIATDWEAKAEDGSRPSTEIVKRRFGTWNAAKKAAGLATHDRGHKSPRDEWIANTVRIEVETHARLEALAARRNTSIAALLREAISAFLEEQQ